MDVAAQDIAGWNGMVCGLCSMGCNKAQVKSLKLVTCCTAANDPLSFGRCHNASLHYIVNINVIFSDLNHCTWCTKLLKLETGSK